MIDGSGFNSNSHDLQCSWPDVRSCMMAAYHNGPWGRFAAGDTGLGHWTSVLARAAHYMV